MKDDGSRERGVGRFVIECPQFGPAVVDVLLLQIKDVMPLKSTLKHGMTEQRVQPQMPASRVDKAEVLHRNRLEWWSSGSTAVQQCRIKCMSSKPWQTASASPMLLMELRILDFVLDTSKSHIHAMVRAPIRMPKATSCFPCRH